MPKRWGSHRPRRRGVGKFPGFNHLRTVARGGMVVALVLHFTKHAMFERDFQSLTEVELSDSTSDDRPEPQWYLQHRLRNYQASTKRVPAAWQVMFEVLIAETQRQIM